MKTTIQKVLFAAIIVANFIMAVPAQAGEKKEIPEVTLKMVGKTNNQPVFQLDVSNAEKDQFYILIKDQDGVVLYEETITGEKTSRLFRLNTEELGAATLTVEVSSRKTARTASFEIVNTVKQVSQSEIIRKTVK